jgi:mannosyltransferase
VHPQHAGPPPWVRPTASVPAWDEDSTQDVPLPPSDRSWIDPAIRPGGHRRRQASEQQSSARSPWPVLALPVALVTGVVAVIGIGRDMWVDEYVTAYVTGLSWEDFRRLVGNQDIVHCLYYVAMRLWTSVFGTSLLALRLPSVIGMAVAAGALALLGRRLHSAALGVTAGLVFAVLPAVSRFGLEARSYAWVIALAVLSTLALTSALERPRAWGWVLYFLVTVALTYLHFAAALVLVPHALMAWYASRTTQASLFRRWLGAAAAVTVAAAPLLYLASRQAGQVSWVKNDWAGVRQYPGQLLSSEPVFWAVAMAAVVGAAQLAQARPGVASPLVAWALVPPVLTYALNDVAHLFLAKYALFTLPAWALLVAAAAVVPLADSRPALSRRQLAGVAAGLLVLSLAGLEGQREARRSPLYGEPDFRAAARVVDAQARPGDGVVYVGTYRWGRLPFAYELRRAKPVDVFAETSMAENGWFSPQECRDPARCLRNVQRIWLVVTNFASDDYLGLPTKEAELLRRQYRPASTATVENARVLLLVRNTPGRRDGRTGG